MYLNDSREQGEFLGRSYERVSRLRLMLQGLRAATPEGRSRRAMWASISPFSLSPPPKPMSIRETAREHQSSVLGKCRSGFEPERKRCWCLLVIYRPIVGQECGWSRSEPVDRTISLG